MLELKQFETKMKQSIEVLSNELMKIQTGRANPLMLSEVMVNYYETPTPLTQLANINVPEPRQLLVKPFDKSTLKDIVAGIKNSNLGLEGVNEGEHVRITIPTLTEETRKVYVKRASAAAEDSKVAIRHIRRDANDKIKKDADFTEDDKRSSEKEIQEYTDKYIKEIEVIFKNKENELTSV